MRPSPAPFLTAAIDVLEHALEWALRGVSAELILDRGSEAVFALVQREGADEHDVVFGDGALEGFDELLRILIPSVGDLKTLASGDKNEGVIDKLYRI